MKNSNPRLQRPRKKKIWAFKNDVNKEIHSIILDKVSVKLTTFNSKLFQIQEM